MTTQEFSNGFDVLYNNNVINEGSGLNEYEKSIFLTKAQNELIKNYFNPKGNKYQEGFDGSEKRQIDFGDLIITSNQPRITVPASGVNMIHPNGVPFATPTDALVLVNEMITPSNNIPIILKPIRYDELNRMLSKPYNLPPKRQGWRIIHKGTADAKYCEIILDYPLKTDIVGFFTCRYVRKPKPIILTTLTSDVAIDGETAITNCELDSVVHPEILQRAIELAKVYYTGDPNGIIQMGQREE